MCNLSNPANFWYDFQPKGFGIYFMCDFNDHNKYVADVPNSSLTLRDKFLS